MAEDNNLCSGCQELLQQVKEIRTKIIVALLCGDAIAIQYNIPKHDVADVFINWLQSNGYITELIKPWEN